LAAWKSGGWGYRRSVTLFKRIALVIRRGDAWRFS
jgi:hypothetical protein